MVKRMYPKPQMAGRPRLCDTIIEEIRRRHFKEELSYAWIAYEMSVHPDTARAYCTGKWRNYITAPIETREQT